MLNNFRSEVQTFSALGLLNITKHSENFMKRVLNLTYGYELENLNKGKANYPGIDLGDTGESIAYQITATKKPNKIDDTLSACLKYKHYETFKTIKVFVLTSKQTSYTLKITTGPHFDFSLDKNIVDFSDLVKDMEHLDLTRLKALHDYIKSELQPTIEAIRNDKLLDKKNLLDTINALGKCRMTNYFHWHSQVTIKNTTFTVPDIYSKLNEFLPTPILKNDLLSILNPKFRKTGNTKEILYMNEVSGTVISNLFYGQAMLIEKSSITAERAIYTNDVILTNLLPEMLMLLTKILFFSKYTKGNFEIEISISMESNIDTHFHPTNSLVIEHVTNSYILDSPFELKEVLTDIKTSTLVKLMQNIIHAFTATQSNFLNNETFLTIRQDLTEFAINGIKNHLKMTSE